MLDYIKRIFADFDELHEDQALLTIRPSSVALPA